MVAASGVVVPQTPRQSRSAESGLQKLSSQRKSCGVPLGHEQSPIFQRIFLEMPDCFAFSQGIVSLPPDARKAYQRICLDSFVPLVHKFKGGRVTALESRMADLLLLREDPEPMADR